MKGASPELFQNHQYDAEDHSVLELNSFEMRDN